MYLNLINGFKGVFISTIVWIEFVILLNYRDNLLFASKLEVDEILTINSEIVDRFKWMYHFLSACIRDDIFFRVTAYTDETDAIIIHHDIIFILVEVKPTYFQFPQLKWFMFVYYLLSCRSQVYHLQVIWILVNSFVTNNQFFVLLFFISHYLHTSIIDF